MLKVRLMGTRRDLRWFRKALERDKRFHILSISEAYANKGTNRYYRMYVDIERKNKKQQ